MQSKKELLSCVFDKFNLSYEDAFISDRQYLEASGKGRIRAEIVKEHKDGFKAVKPDIATCLRDPEALDEYIGYLKGVFSGEIPKCVPRWSVDRIITDALKKYPLIEELNFIKKKLKNHGQLLQKLPVAYKGFTDQLIEDSVIRYALAFINFKEVLRLDHDQAMKLLNSMISKLMIKYASSQGLGVNLILMASALRSAILAREKPQDKASPMFRVEDDIADIEVAHLMLYGLEKNKAQIPVTVITNESKMMTYERLHYDVIASGLKAQFNGSQTLRLGRIILLNFKNFTHEVITGEYLRDKFKTVTGDPLF